MKNKKSYCLIAIVITVVIALLVFVCLNFRIMRVDKVKIIDDNVRALLEEIADIEKTEPIPGLFILAHTTTNSIIAQPTLPYIGEIGDSVFGRVVVNGVKFIISENKLAENIPTVFEKTGGKTTILKFSSFAFNHTLPYLDLEDIFDDWDAYGFKFKDGKWSESTWGETVHEQWVSEHPDTLVLTTPIKPSFVNKYPSLNEKDFNEFINEWKKWSSQLRSFSKEALINQAISRVFTEYNKNNPDSCTLCSLPGCIEVRRYPGSFSDYPYEVPLGETREWEYMAKASERFAYVPSFDSDKEIVYITPEIDRLLSQYIGGVCESEEDDYTDHTKWTKVNEERLNELRKLIQVNRGHWGGYWHFESMPKIFSLYLYDDGVVADLRTSWCTGETVFLPYDKTKEKVSLSDWIE